MSVDYKPEGFHSITPYMIVKGAAELIEFMNRAFNAEEGGRHLNADGTIAHAWVRIGDSSIELSEANERFPAMPSALHLYVENSDQVYAAALEAGATSTLEPTNQFYGDREAGIIDPSGNHWFIATRIETISTEEMNRRSEEHIQAS